MSGDGSGYMCLPLHALLGSGVPHCSVGQVHDSYTVSCSGLIKYRREHPLLGQKHFLSPQDITWHEDNWDNPESKYLAFSLHDRSSCQPLNPVSVLMCSLSQLQCPTPYRTLVYICWQHHVSSACPEYADDADEYAPVDASQMSP